MLYAADGNPYPRDAPILSPYGACLGAGYVDDKCWIGPSGNYKVEPTVDTVLQKYIGSKPMVPNKMYTLPPNENRSGIVYFPSRANDIPYLEYFLDGKDQDCQLQSVTGVNVAAGTATVCRLHFPKQ